MNPDARTAGSNGTSVSVSHADAVDLATAGNLDAEKRRAFGAKESTDDVMAPQCLTKTRTEFAFSAP